MSESVRILCIGDPHFTEDAILDMEQFSKKTINLIEKSDPKLDLVVVLGDILDRFEKAHLIVHTQAMKWLYQISTHCRLLILIGNHDRINNKVYLTDESFFWACRHWPNVTVADTPTFLNIEGYNFVGVPYVSPGRFSEALSTLNDIWKEATAIFAHQEMKGCSLGIIKSEEGDPWSDDLPLLISGHIHEYERLGKEKVSIVYVGTPRMKTFGDHKRKTVSVFTFNSDKSWSEDKIDLGLPKKVSIKLTVSQITNATEFLSLSQNLNGTLRITIQGTQSELSVGLKHPIVKHLRSLGAKIIPDEIQVSENSKESIDINIPEKDEPEHISKTELQKIIWQKVSENPELFEVLKSLFGTIKIKLGKNT